jgi:hypothetical protein
MNARKRLIRATQANKPAIAAGNVPFPLPEGKPELFNYKGEMRRWNVETGKYDLKA